ncbi:hypothetical protein CKO15_01155 [Halorhodospira abdelmalekii]|uniref:LEA type 2 family protein n=1 Tax=Halorhodospira abdelmalekii TaxID=421629 RepID=UPI0019064826|nr:LEA type 2 family protein [Halorhodospira abdelmalekii]MBK1733908.1 hypothetical protein [Halorhodospira abdelmalekii]
MQHRRLWGRWNEIGGGRAGALSLVVVALLLLSACAALQDRVQEPEVSVKGFEVTGFSSQGLDLDLNLTAHNPNALGLSLAGLSYQLDLNDRGLIRGASDQRVRLPRRDSADIRLPLQLDFSDLADLGANLGTLLRQEQTAYRLRGELDFGLFSVPYDHSGDLRLPSMPRLRVENLRIEEMSLRSAKVQMALEIENPNDFPIDIEQLRYALALDGRSVASGNTLEGLRLSGGDRKSQDLSVDIDFSEFAALFSNLRRGGNVPFALDAALELPGGGEKHALPLQWEGRLGL